MKPEDAGSKAQGPKEGRGTDRASGQDKTWDVEGFDPKTGEPLPSRTVTTREWREEKLGKAGYTKPADLDETAPDTE